MSDVVTTLLQENLKDYGINDYEDRKVGLNTSLWQCMFVLQTGKDSFLGPHFETKGGMLTSQMLKEIPTIIINAHRNGIRTFTLCGDAASTNMSLFLSTLQLQHDQKSKSFECSIDCVSMINPADPTLRIFIITCGAPWCDAR